MRRTVKEDGELLKMKPHEFLATFEFYYTSL